MLNSLRYLEKNNKPVYDILNENECTVMYNGITLFEGKLKDFVNDTKYDKSLIVYRFNINDNVLFLTEGYNEYVKQLDINNIDEMLNDPKKFNQMMLLANNLPLFNLDITDESIKENIRKYGTNYRKIYENLLLKNVETDMKEINDTITEEYSYDNIIQKLNEAKENNIPVDEGILGAIGGAILGTAFGPKLGNAICNALGVDPKGTFGSLITSRLVMAAIGAKMGWKM